MPHGIQRRPVDNADCLVEAAPSTESYAVGVCGRFVATHSPDRIADFFGATFDAPSDASGAGSLAANYNVAPTHDVYAVVAEPSLERTVAAFRWGLVPSWAKDLKIGSKMINARAETIAEKPAFKGLFAKHRLIIPMAGFYEWRTEPAPAATDGAKPLKPIKTPMFIHAVNNEPLAAAGLWARWRDPNGDPHGPMLHTCTVITTSANDTMAPVHDRMPVLLPKSKWAEWLDPTNRDVATLQQLLQPAPNELLTMYPVSPLVNSVRNTGAQLVEPAPAVEL